MNMMSLQERREEDAVPEYVRELAAEASWLKKPYSAMDLAVRIRELLD